MQYVIDHIKRQIENNIRNEWILTVKYYDVGHWVIVDDSFWSLVVVFPRRKLFLRVMLSLSEEMNDVQSVVHIRENEISSSIWVNGSRQHMTKLRQFFVAWASQNCHACLACVPLPSRWSPGLPLKYFNQRGFKCHRNTLCKHRRKDRRAARRVIMNATRNRLGIKQDHLSDVPLHQRIDVAEKNDLLQFDALTKPSSIARTKAEWKDRLQVLKDRSALAAMESWTRDEMPLR